jgi:AI-2 transport protein TqsA
VFDIAGTETRSEDAVQRAVKPVLIAILAILAVAALRATRPVTLPLASAFFLVALVWPFQKWLERRVPAGLDVLASMLILLTGAALFAGAIWWAVQPIVERGPDYLMSPTAAVTEIERWARDSGVPLPGGRSDGSAAGGATFAFGRADLVSLISGLVLALAFAALALLETGRQRRLMRRSTHPLSDHWLHVTHRMGRGFRRYLAVRTGVGLLTGLATGLVAWAVGLEMALVWGALNFLLNYIPTIGSILAVAPPTLYALAEHGTGMAAMALAGIGGVQLVMGSWIDPLAQGRALRLSPLVVLVAVAFWGWVWGVAGAFLGVPITLAAVLALDEFDRTRWMATALGAGGGERDGAGHENGPAP